MSSRDKLLLTDSDIARYEKRIKNIDLNLVSKIIEQVPNKLESLVNTPDLNEYQVTLINDVSKLYTILKRFPDISTDLKKRIVFALEYFIVEEDEINDRIPGIGLLDDYVLVRWVVDKMKTDYAELFLA